MSAGGEHPESPVVAPEVVGGGRRIGRSDHSISRRNIDPDAIKVLYRLYRAGHTAYLVGGGVRDLLLGRVPKDFDIVTSARPAQVKRLFRNCKLIGRRFRLAHLHFPNGKLIELSTFRAQPDLSATVPGEEEDLLVLDDNRFGTPRQDAERRDFTINSLFYDISSFSLIDYVGGLDDIRHRMVRTIGDPMQRFQEDPVRMVRAVKFSARLGFGIEQASWEAMNRLAPLIHRSAPARVSEELARLLEEGAASRSLQLLDASGLLEAIDLNLEAYLRLAERGEAPHDPDGRMLYRLLDRCDGERASGKLSRPLLFSIWVLPIALYEGLLDNESGEGWNQAAYDCASRLGLARREMEQVSAILELFRRLALRRKRKRGQGRPLEEREGFLEALRLLEFYCPENPDLQPEYEYWLARREQAGAQPLPARGAGGARPQRTRGRRRLRRRGGGGDEDGV